MKTKIKKSILLKSVFALIALFTFLNAGAQVIASHPAANLEGTLKAKISDGNIVIKSNMLTSDANPVIKYTLVNNSSGATIVSTSAYNFSSGRGTQNVVINPGSSNGGFELHLEVTSGGQTAKSVKTVAIQQ